MEDSNSFSLIARHFCAEPTGFTNINRRDRRRGPKNYSPAGGPVHIMVTPGSHTISLPALILVGNSMRFRFETWSDGLTDPTRILDLEADTSLTANYVTQYQLTLTSAQGNVTGSGWYDLGSVATFSAPPSSPLWTFQGWYEGDRQVTSSINGSITMNAPHSLTARWAVDYTILGSIVGVVVMATVGLAYYGKRRRRDHS